jgi:hypothetical protein
VRHWAAYFQYATAARTFAYLGQLRLVAGDAMASEQHPKRTRTQFRRRYSARRESKDKGVTLYNPGGDARRVLPLPGALILTPWNEATGDPTGGRGGAPATKIRCFLERLEKAQA